MSCSQETNFKYSKTPIKPDQLEKIVQKQWGHEEWIINTEKYCGKKLVFKKGYSCSLHFHKIKDETFYLISGIVIIELKDKEAISSRVMTPGDSQRILPEVHHRVIALENSEIIEFSTFHVEEDSYRITLSGKIDLKTF